MTKVLRCLAGLVFLAAAARAEVGVLPAENLDKENAAQALQQQLDQAFSTSGGTVAGRVFISSHVEVTDDVSADRFCFRRDGSCLTTAPPSTICRVLQSTTTYNIPGTTGINTTLKDAIAGSTLTLTGVTAGSYARFCPRLPMDKTADGAYGCSPLLNGVIVTTYSTSVVSRPLWREFSNNAGGNETKAVTGCYTHPTALSAGTNTASLACMTAANTWTLRGESNTDFANWWTFQEVNCAD